MFFNKTNKYKIHEENDFKILKISVKDLVSNYTIQNYYKNRPPDNVRINFLEEFFTINDTFLLPQIVSSWEKDDKLFIYDGIHRLTASMNLFKNKNKNMLVIIKIFTTKDETKIIKDFKEINSAICVPWLYMEEDNNTKKIICESVVDKLATKFKYNLSHSRNCQKQNFNRDNMIDLIASLNIDFYKHGVDLTIFNYLLTLNLLAKDYIKENNIKTPKKCDYYSFWLMYLPREEIINKIENGVLFNI